MELVRRGPELLPGERGDLLRHLRIEAGRRIEAGPDRGSAERELGKRPDGELQELCVALERGSPAGDLLGKCNRHRVLQMRSSALHDPLMLLLQRPHNLDQPFRCRKELILDCQDRRNVHRGRKRIVRGLAHVDVVVRVAELSARELVGAVRDDLVGVHVGLGPGPGLPDDEREMVHQLPFGNLAGGLPDHGQLLVSHFFGLKRVVGAGGGHFQDTERADDLLRHGFDADPDLKVFMAALGLGGPVAVGGDFHFPHGVMFDAVFHSGLLLIIKL